MSNQTVSGDESLQSLIRSSLGVFPDWPKKGVVFLDIFPCLRSPLLFEALISSFVSHIFDAVLPQTPHKKIDAIVGLDARGFLIGPVIASRLQAAFVPVRKAGKLPGPCAKATFSKEYGEDICEMQKDAIKPGQTVIIVDDLIATGGSAYAAGDLVSQSGGKVLSYMFIIELLFLSGSEKLKAPVWSLIKEESE